MKVTQKASRFVYVTKHLQPSVNNEINQKLKDDSGSLCELLSFKASH